MIIGHLSLITGHSDMPNIGSYHPIIVHFAIALLVVGVIFRWIWLTGRVPFTGPAAATLILAGAVAALLAVHSGTDAHGPVERIPGARNAVGEHEEWGERTRNIVLIGFFPLFEAAEHGGDIVYSYAGGVGTRSGDTADVSRLNLAGLYQAAQAARARHDSARAAELFGELARRFPGDTNVRLLAIESLVRDKNDGRAALTALAQVNVAADDRRLRLRVGFLKADAYVAAGKPDSARATLEQLGRDFPDMDQRIKDRLKNVQ